MLPLRQTPQRAVPSTVPAHSSSSVARAIAAAPCATGLERQRFSVASPAECTLLLRLVELPFPFPEVLLAPKCLFRVSFLLTCSYVHVLSVSGRLELSYPTVYCASSSA